MRKDDAQLQWQNASRMQARTMLALLAILQVTSTAASPASLTCQRCTCLLASPNAQRPEPKSLSLPDLVRI